jgi:hypothetical protein
MYHKLHQPRTQLQSKLKQPPELLHQKQTYKTPKSQMVDLTQDDKTPPPNDPNDRVPLPPTKTSKAPDPTQNQTIQASYTENFHPLEQTLAKKIKQGSTEKSEREECHLCQNKGTLQI